MKIERNAFVSLAYTLRTDGAEGPIVEQTTEETPLRFVFGAGQMLEMFEKHIDSLEAGEKFSFTLTPEEAYGEREEEAVVDLPKSIFMINGEMRDDLLVPGSHIPMMSEGGQRLDGIVLAVEQDTVKMDFNHPMAGETLNFEGHIIEVREATVEELIGPQGGCGGSCGGCGGGCHGGGCGDGEEGGCCGGCH